jgi:hypothetical protein
MGRDVSMTPKERAQAIQKYDKLQIGDLIFVKTPKTFFQALRRICDEHYDHIVVVLDQEKCLHISYPTAKLVSTHVFSHVKRSPLIVRPKFSSEAKRHAFVNGLKDTVLGKRYDSLRVFNYLRQNITDRVKSTMQNAVR